METNSELRYTPCRLCSTFSDPVCQSRRNNHLCPIHTHNCCCCRRRYHRSSKPVIRIFVSTFVWCGPNTCKPCNIYIPFFSLQEQAKARSQLTVVAEQVSNCDHADNHSSANSPQQSPPSQSHAQLLLLSSQFLSPFQLGEPHLPPFLGHFFTWALQSLHLHSVLMTL